MWASLAYVGVAIASGEDAEGMLNEYFDDSRMAAVGGVMQACHPTPVALVDTIALLEGGAHRGDDPRLHSENERRARGEVAHARLLAREWPQLKVLEHILTRVE